MILRQDRRQKKTAAERGHTDAQQAFVETFDVIKLMIQLALCLQETLDIGVIGLSGAGELDGLADMLKKCQTNFVLQS